MQFLQWCLPHLGMRWQGFRNVRRRVYKRLKRRLHELGLVDFEDYKTYLADHREEWAVLSSLCWMPISRFYRDHDLFHLLETDVLPPLAQIVSETRDKQMRCWSAGCASGEEPHTLAILWHRRLAHHYPTIDFRILATDIDPQAIQRAQRGCYRWSSIKELPTEWQNQAFNFSGGEFCLKDEYRHTVSFVVQDLRESAPDGRFHLVLCRNLAFTYFNDAIQQETLGTIYDKLVPGGALIIGKLETLPNGSGGLAAWFPHIGIYRKPFTRGVDSEIRRFRSFN